MISANGGLPAHRYTPQVTPRWPPGSEPASGHGGQDQAIGPRVQKLLTNYLELFGELPPPASSDKLVQMDLKLKPEFVGHKIRRRPYPAPKEQADEIE